MTPSLSTSTPELARPATTAASRKSPDARESRPMIATGRRSELATAAAGARTGTAATARSMASWAVSSTPATPRTPSVPKIRPISVNLGCQPRLTLGVLRRLAGLLEPVLLPLRSAGVPGEEAGLLQRRAVLRVDERQGPGQAKAQR